MTLKSLKLKSASLLVAASSMLAVTTISSAVSAQELPQSSSGQKSFSQIAREKAKRSQKRSGKLSGGEIAAIAIIGAAAIVALSSNGR